MSEESNTTAERGRPSTSCSAFVVETSDDGWETSEVYGVTTTLIQAAMLGRELCFRWRVRHAKVTIGGLLTDADIQNAEESLERLEKIFDEPNTTAMASPPETPTDTEHEKA